MPCRLTRLVISRIRTGATRLARSFLWTQRKLISTIFFSLKIQERIESAEQLCKISPEEFFLCLEIVLVVEFLVLTLHSCTGLHVIDADSRRNGTDEAHQLLVGVDPHSTMPLRQPARGPQGPERIQSVTFSTT